MTMKVYARGHRKSGDGHEGWTTDLAGSGENYGYAKDCKTDLCRIEYMSYCGDREQNKRHEYEERFKIQDCDGKKAYMANSSRKKLCTGRYAKSVGGACRKHDMFSQCSTVCSNNIKGYKTDARNPCWDTKKRGFIRPPLPAAPEPPDEASGLHNIDGPYYGGFFGLQCEYTPDEAQVIKSSGIDEHTNTLGFDGVRIKDTELSPTVQNKWGTIYQQLKWGARVPSGPFKFDTREQGLCSDPKNSEKKVDAKTPKATTCFEDGREQWSEYLKENTGIPNAYRSQQYKKVALHHCTKVPNAEDNLLDEIFESGFSDKKCHTYFRNEVDEKDLVEKFCLKGDPPNMQKEEYQRSLCNRERLGDHKYEAMAAKYCLNNPTDPWCGCYNAVENKCRVDESLPGCNKNLVTWELMKEGLSSDEIALFSGMRQCFENVCSGNTYKPHNWKEACNRRVNICKSEIDIGGAMINSTIIEQQDYNNEGAPPPSFKPLSKMDKFLENIFSFREDQDKKFMEKRYVRISIVILLILILGAVISGAVIIV